MTPLKLPALDVNAVAEVRGSGYPQPFKARMGDRAKRRLGDACGLTKLGVNLVTLGPGGQSALRHWHTLEDEFVYVLEGEVVLVTDAGEQVLKSGTCAGYPAGKRDAHHFINRSTRPASSSLCFQSRPASSSCRQIAFGRQRGRPARSTRCASR